MFGINNCPTFSQSEERVCAENPECTHQWSEWSQWSVGCPRLSFLFVSNWWLLVLLILSLKAKVDNRGFQKTPVPTSTHGHPDGQNVLLRVAKDTF